MSVLLVFPDIIAFKFVIDEAKPLIVLISINILKLLPYLLASISNKDTFYKIKDNAAKNLDK
jgi:hypothetical protein